MTPVRVLVALWAAWAISWGLAAVWYARAEKRAGVGRQLGYRAVTVAGALLMFAPLQGRAWAIVLWRAGGVAAWACVAAELCGFVFAWWARIHLGKLWSGAITLKTGHRVVEDGPYRLVRHPIYTGILLALYASLAMAGSVAGIAGAALMTAGFFWKARIEESWLAHELGPAYDEYRRRVPMLVPFV